MEQLRAILEILKKYHFWILCGLIVLITFGSWYMATSERSGNYEARKKKIEGEYKGAQQISQKADHPSTTYNTALKLRLTFDPSAPEDARNLAKIQNADDTLSSNVASANQRLFEEQKNLKIPPIYDEGTDEQARFEERFRDVWNHKIEDIEKQQATLSLDPKHLNYYRDRIKNFFPRLFDVIDRRREVKDKDDPTGGANVGPRGRFGQPAVADDTKQWVGTVTWNGAEAIMERFEKWPNDTPSTLQVMLAQEDFWVYEALLRVIRNTNDFGNDPKHAPANYRKPPSHKAARIKEILALEIGNEAVQSWAASENSVVTLPTDSSAPTTGTTPTAPLPPMPMVDRGKAGYLQSGVSAGQGGSPLAGRYVDNLGKPVTDMTQPAPNEEFRMMPIDMKLIIEQKDIPRLLVECANSSMRIDVRAVRLLVDKPGPFPDSGAGGALPMAGGMPTSRMDFGMSKGRGMGHGTTSSSDTSTEESADAIYPPVPVEIQGIIYIYNPPEAPAGQENNGQTASTAAGAPAAAPAGGAAPQGVPAPAAGTPVPKPGATPPATAPAAPVTPAPTVPTAPAAVGPAKPTR